MLNIVTGGAGFLGSHLVNALVDDGESVIVIDNLSTGHIRNLEHAISSGRATFIYADVAVTSPVLAELIYNATKDHVRRVFHLATPATPDSTNRTSWETLEANALGTMSLIEIALAHEATFLFASSAAVYGSSFVQTQPESYFGIAQSASPKSWFEEGKRFGEAAVAAAVHTRGLDGRIVRLYDSYGPTMSDCNRQLITELFRVALAGEPFPIGGMEERSCPLIYVEDAISLVRLVMGSRRSGFVPVNVGSDDELTVAQIARAVADIAGVEFKVCNATGSETVPQFLKPDLTVARSYGWREATSLDDGLRATFRWLRTERVAFA